MLSRLKSFLACPAAVLAGLVFVLFLSTGCQTPQGHPITQEDMTPYLPTEIAQGATLEIVFPSAPNLNTVQKVGVDGTIILQLVGQVYVLGKTIEELKQELLKLYETELLDEEVLISMGTSGHSVYVTGNVLRPGKVPLDKPLTVLEAIMEAGGYGAGADLEEVSVIRYYSGRNVTYYLDLEPVLSGGPVSPFYLRPGDIVTVPQKIQWF